MDRYDNRTHSFLSTEQLRMAGAVLGRKWKLTPTEQKVLENPTFRHPRARPERARTSERKRQWRQLVIRMVNT